MVMHALSIGEIDQMAASLLAGGKALREGDAISIKADQIGIDKILGSGKVTLKMNITARAFSAQAKSKIEAMGGQALVI
jgi:large subunit ribosomal protein L15